MGVAEPFAFLVFSRAYQRCCDNTLTVETKEIFYLLYFRFKQDEVILFANFVCVCVTICLRSCMIRKESNSEERVCEQYK